MTALVAFVKEGSCVSARGRLLRAGPCHVGLKVARLLGVRQVAEPESCRVLSSDSFLSTLSHWSLRPKRLLPACLAPTERPAVG